MRTSIPILKSTKIIFMNFNASKDISLRNSIVNISNLMIFIQNCPNLCNILSVGQINADTIAASTGELLTGNMFAYCRNNRVPRLKHS
ncbi:MAG: hypothetical protein Q8936_21090 [Bacillota bacterium]|nr:hypothetical protein [Bacillota bacterium]